MRRFIIPAAAVAALALAPDTAHAQIVIQSGYAQPYYGGYYSQPYYGGYSQPYYGGYSQSYTAPIGQGGLVQAAEGYLLNQTGLGSYVAPYTTGYGGYSTYGTPYFGSSYGTYTPYFGGYNTYRSFGGFGRSPFSHFFPVISATSPSASYTFRSASTIARLSTDTARASVSS
jgi:hypothetical protein